MCGTTAVGQADVLASIADSLRLSLNEAFLHTTWTWSLQPQLVEPVHVWHIEYDASTTGPPALVSTEQPGPPSITLRLLHLPFLLQQQLMTELQPKRE